MSAEGNTDDEGEETDLVVCAWGLRVDTGEVGGMKFTPPEDPHVLHWTSILEVGGTHGNCTPLTPEAMLSPRLNRWFIYGTRMVHGVTNDAEFIFRPSRWQEFRNQMTKLSVF